MSAPLTLTRLSGFDRNKSADFDGPQVTLGTDAACSLRFDPTWDRTVNGCHAELIWEADQWWVVDGSEHGTWIDGQRVQRRKVPGGTVLELGKGGPKVRLDWTPLPPPVESAQVSPAVADPLSLSPAPAATPASPPPPPLVPMSRSRAKPPLKFITGISGVVLLLAVLAWWLWGRGGGGGEQGLAAVARDKSGAVGLVVGARSSGEGGQPQGIATAWAIEPRVFATNAHVVESVDQVMREGGSAFVVINREGERRLRVTGTRMHPRYRSPMVGFDGKDPAVPAYDVGLLLTDSPAPEVLRIAGGRELQRVDSGYRVAYLGFPMEGMAGGGADVRSPVATMQSGIVTSATDFWLAKADYPKRLLIQHNLGAAGGASGSPLFNAEGEVVGILSAGNIAGVTRSGGKIARVPSGVLVNFAQRVDLLGDIWSGYP